MKIQLVDRNKKLCEVWKSYFADCEDVSIHHADYLDIPATHYVSPANSFGFMDGGIDILLVRFYEEHDVDIQNEVRKMIIGRFNGEVLVGQAFCYWTSPVNLIVAPTMRVPMIISETVNVYLAAKAIFREMRELSYGRKEEFTVSIPGLGTGVGRMSYDSCAKQMRQAYNEVMMGTFEMPRTWQEAQTNHQLMYTNDVGNIQFKNPLLK